jgi:hypothetical protein
MTNGGPGSAPGVEVARMERHFQKVQSLHVQNQNRPAVLELDECLYQLGIRAGSARGVVLKQLLDQPATLQQLCERIERTPALGDRGDQPANTKNVYAALRHIKRKAHECAKFNIVEQNGVYSAVVK